MNHIFREMNAQKLKKKLEQALTGGASSANTEFNILKLHSSYLLIKWMATRPVRTLEKEQPQKA